MNSSSNFKPELLPVDDFVKVNKLKEINNPIFFVRDNIPTNDGLLSNEIFGITNYDRSNIFAYIDLFTDFLHPYVYKIWSRMDNKIIDLVHGQKKFIIDNNGYLIEDENGKTGLSFLKANMDKIKIRPTDSDRRDTRIKVIEQNRNLLFINKCVVIPVGYRDVNSGSDKSSASIGVGEINRMYTALLIAVRSLKDAKDYGIDMTDVSKGRIQEYLLNIYNWFTSEPNLPKKKGIIRRAGLSKTTDYASRLVISSPNIDAERYTDIPVTMDYSAVPLASVCTNLYPFMIFNMRHIIDTMFPNNLFPIIDKKNKKITTYEEIEDKDIQFSDERLKKELNRYMRGFSNRFIPVTVVYRDKQGKQNEVKLRFIGRKATDENDKTPLYERTLTWCDIIYQAAVEAAKDKTVLITRYPLEDYFGQYPSKIIVASTKETEPMYVNNVIYKTYPKILEEDIGQDTSNKFVDTLHMTNLRLQSIGGDYDGDQVTVKAPFNIESNIELEKHINSKKNYINVSGLNIMVPKDEALQAIYSLTKTKKQYDEVKF